MALFGAILLVFILFVRPQEFVAGLENLSILNVATGVAVLGIVYEFAIGRLKNWRTPQFPFLLAFVGWCIVVTFVKAGTSAVLDMKTTILFSMIFMFIVMYAGATFEGYRAIGVTILAIMLALAFVCTRPSIGPYECIVLDKDEDGLVARDQSSGESDGRPCESWHDCATGSKSFSDDFVCEQPGWFKTFTVAHGRVRWRGTLADPNELSLAIGAAISFAFALHASMKKKIRHVALLAGVALATYCVVLTGSRGGVLVLLAVFGTYFVRRFGPKGLLLAIAFGAPVLLLGGRNDESADSSSLERLGALYNGMGFVKSNPILGLGQGQFVENYFITAHNSYVLACAELGFPGLVIWTSLIYVSVKIPYTIASSPPADLDPRLVPYAFALVTSFAGICVGISFLSFCYHNMLFIYFGLSGALYLAAKRSSPSFEVKVKPKEIGYLAGFDLALMAFLFVYTRIKGEP
jgi:hypothetical protein